MKHVESWWLGWSIPSPHLMHFKRHWLLYLNGMHLKIRCNLKFLSSHLSSRMECWIVFSPSFYSPRWVTWLPCETCDGQPRRQRLCQLASQSTTLNLYTTGRKKHTLVLMRGESWNTEVDTLHICFWVSSRLEEIALKPDCSCIFYSGRSENQHSSIPSTVTCVLGSRLRMNIYALVTARWLFQPGLWDQNVAWTNGGHKLDFFGKKLVSSGSPFAISMTDW